MEIMDTNVSILVDGALGYGGIVKYSKHKIEFCCDELEFAYTDLHITPVDCNLGGHPQKEAGVMVYTKEPLSDYHWKFCPFCGQKIEMVE